MKLINKFAVAVIALALSATGALGADYFMGAQDYATGVPSQSEKALTPDYGSGIMIQGSLVSLGEESHELMVSTTVPGLFGPQETTIPFTVGDNTTMTICFESLSSCQNSSTGQEGWRMLSDFESMASFNAAHKDVVIVEEPDSGQVVHVEVHYNI